MRTENPRVGGSIPPLGTIKIKDLAGNWQEGGVATAFEASRAFSRPYHPLPNIPCNTDATRCSCNVLAVLHTTNVTTALDLWLSGFASENTRRAYRKEIEAFAAFAGWDDVAEAVTHFLALEDGPAHAVADRWRAEKIARGFPRLRSIAPWRPSTRLWQAPGGMESPRFAWKRKA